MEHNEKISPHIGHNISAIRRMRNMKQSAFASSLGISQQAVSKMEKNADISYSRLLHVANVLGVSVDAIRLFSEVSISGQS